MTGSFESYIISQAVIQWNLTRVELKYFIRRYILLSKTHYFCHVNHTHNKLSTRARNVIQSLFYYGYNLGTNVIQMRVRQKLKKKAYLHSYVTFKTKSSVENGCKMY
jgi:hypothetical protein